ncbi:MAG: tetratricopeptide repeat protein [Chitinophagales bacterium]|nr:tetratricopeptide repeat protein [Chitinophagales bacterium]
MEDRESDESLPVDIRTSVDRFEEMVRNQDACFFDVSTFEQIVNFYEQKEQWKKAIHVMDVAIAQHPYSPWFFTKKASLLIYFKKYKQALELIDQAEAMDPSDIGLYILRSDIYLERNQHQHAVDMLEAAIRICDAADREELYLEMADAYEDWDRYDAVFDCLKKVLEINQENEEALSRMWYCVELAGRHEESITLHNTIIDNNPYSYLAWHNLGHAYFDTGLFEKAIEAYEFVTVINESCDLAYRDCGEAYYKLKQYTKAIEQFQKAIEFSKPYEELYYSIGICYEKLREYGKSRSYYRKAISVDPKYCDAFFRIGETFRKEKAWTNAVHFYKKALRLMPDNINYLMGMAQGFYNLGEIDPFIFACQSVMALNQRYKRKSDYEKLVGYLIDLECYEDAMQLMDFAALEKGPVASYAFLRSVCLLRVGERREALAWLEEGLSAHYSKHKLLYKFAPDLREDAVVSSIVEQYK